MTRNENVGFYYPVVPREWGTYRSVDMERVSRHDLRTRAHCSHCGNEGRPLLRVWGMPCEGVDWVKHVREGRYTLMGCNIPLEHVADYECRHCGQDMHFSRVRDAS